MRVETDMSDSGRTNIWSDNPELVGARFPDASSRSSNAGNALGAMDNREPHSLSRAWVRPHVIHAPPLALVYATHSCASSLFMSARASSIEMVRSSYTSA